MTQPHLLSFYSPSACNLVILLPHHNKATDLGDIVHGLWYAFIYFTPPRSVVVVLNGL